MNGQKRAWRAISLLAATLAATITLAILAGCSSGKRDGASERLVAVNFVSPHRGLSDCLRRRITGRIQED
jgi:hypothetical protein